MKIEKDYFIEQEKFTEVFSVERIDFKNDNAYYKTEATYTTLKEALKEWLKDWSECVKCNHMCKNTLLRTTNEDELICNDCVTSNVNYRQG